MRIARYFMVVGILGIAPLAHAQEAEINDQARAHFQAGVNFLQDPDGARYEEAYREFSAAYRASPSWKILGNLGIAAMKLERDGEAIAAFEKYLSGGASALAPEEREQFERDLNTLKAGVVRITLEVSQPGATIVDERQPVTGSAIRNSYLAESTKLDIGVRAGHHRITAKLAGYEDATVELEAVSGEPLSRTLTLSPAKPAGAGAAGGSGSVTTERPTPTGVYVGLAATGAFAIGAGVVGVMALGKKSDFDEANNGRDTGNANDLSDSTKTLNLVTDVLIGAAVVSAGVTTYLYLSRPKVESPTSGWIRIQPQVGLQSSSLQLTGAF